MNKRSPQVFLIGETRVMPSGMDGMLTSLGVQNWSTDAGSDQEFLAEVAGKLCYMSFDVKLNSNLTRTNTRDNLQYLQEGIIKHEHFSVLEHASVTLAFINVSRVFTHELVRHRHGAYSQESGRYVRRKDVNLWEPSVIKGAGLGEAFEKAAQKVEQAYNELVAISGVNESKDFEFKKWMTSALRRILPEGRENNIIATYNHRSLREIIAKRTSRHAEEEIRKVFSDVFDLVSAAYPAFYADARSELVNGLQEVTFLHFNKEQ